MIDLVVEYDGGINCEIDAKVEKALKGTGAKHGGSGCCLFGAGTRDMCFYFSSVAKANAAKKKLEAAKLGVRVSVAT